MRELKFRAVIKEQNATIFFTLADIADPSPIFSIREILLPWLRAGNKPDVFTGLTDKNSKEIYEGDIVKQKRCQCDDCKKLGEWRIFIIETYDYRAGNTKIARSEEIEVIGNIYENPKLLESK